MSRRIPVLVLMLALLAAACGTRTGTDGASPGVESESFPVTIDAPNGPVVLQEAATRVVSLSATATEMLFAIDAGDQVVAVDDQSNYPADAPKTKLSGLTPSAEAIAEHDPDLVVLANDTNDIVKALTQLDVNVLLQPAAVKLDDSYTQLEQLGRATGHRGDAAEVVRSMKDRVAELRRSVPDFDEPPTYYHELDKNLFSVTSDTFIGQVYALAGLRNIADAAKGAESGYPQLTSEYVVQADPDVIFLADAGRLGESPRTVSARPGWDRISAVRSGSIVELNEDVASRWGPRVVEFLEVVVREVSELESRDAA